MASRIVDEQTKTPQYPTANYRALTSLGYRANAILRSCIDTLSTQLVQAWPEVVDRETGATQVGHDLTQRLACPAPWMTGVELRKRFIQDAYLCGNSYWEKVRGRGSDAVVQLWRLDPSRILIEPDPVHFIKRYLYQVGGEWYPIPTRDILHWKFPDPLQPYFGIPPIYSAFRDLNVDNELIDHLKITLQNLGVPALALMHENSLEQDEADEIRSRFKARQAGIRRGEPAILGSGTKVEVLGMDMQKMAIGDLSATSESRIAMVHRIPTILLGRSGTQSDPTRANYAEAKEHFWFDTVGPLLEEIAEHLTQFLLAEWDPEGLLEVRWNTSNVAILQEAKLRRAGKASELFSSGLVSRSRAQRLAGVEVHGPDVFYRSGSVEGIVPGDAIEENLELTEI